MDFSHAHFSKLSPPPNSRHIHHRGIHSVRYIQGVHILHTGMHQPWAQPHAFHKSYIHDLDHVHNIHCIPDHVHSILHTNKHQHQPWAQLHAFHSSYILGHGTQNIPHIQDHVHSIHHTGRALLQPHAFHNSCTPVLGSQNIQGVQVHTHHIHHTEGRGQHQPWTWPQAQQ